MIHNVGKALITANQGLVSAISHAYSFDLDLRGNAQSTSHQLSYITLVLVWLRRESWGNPHANFHFSTLIPVWPRLYWLVLIFIFLIAFHPLKWQVSTSFNKFQLSFDLLKSNPFNITLFVNDIFQKNTLKTEILK